MIQDWRHLPPAARPIAAAASAAIAAAKEQDAEALDRAVAELAAPDPLQVGLILGTGLRLQLERGHPDGLDGDDIRLVLTGCVREAAAWRPQVDPHVLLYLLAGALGVLEEDGEPPPRPTALAEHAALLLTHLRATPELFTAALSEIERSQLND